MSKHLCFFLTYAAPLALRVPQFFSLKKINGFNTYLVVARAALLFSIRYKREMILQELQWREKASGGRVEFPLSPFFPRALEIAVV